MNDKLRKKLEDRRDKLESGSGGFNFIIFKDEGTKRMRPVPIAADGDFAVEAITFYLGEKLKGYVSPATFGEKCPMMKLYQKLSQSDDPKDKAFAKSFEPRKKWYVPHIVYKDVEGKEVDTEMGVKLAQLTNQQYKQILELYLDPENGDFTDPKEGYDLKYKRKGKGKMDTKYTVTPCKPSKCPKEYRGPYDPEEMLKAIIPTYEKALEIKKQFVSGDEDSGKKEKKSDT